MKNDEIKSADGLKYRIIAIAELVFILGIIILRYGIISNL